MTTQRTTRKQTARQTTQPADTWQAAADNPELQGEGNYTAARRHRESVERFVGSGEVQRSARDAAPRSEQEARELRAAEKAGRAHARK